MRHLGVVCLVLAVAACGDDGAGERAADAGTPDTVLDAGAIDAGTSGGDASPSPADGAAPPESDGGVADGGGVDAGMATLRQTVCGDVATWPDPLPAPGMRSARKLADGFGFVEGPVWVGALDALLFSDMNFGGGDALGPPSQIRRIGPPSSVDGWVGSSGSNGLALFAPDTLLAATHDTRSLSFFDVASGERSDVAITYQGKKLNSPNDLTVRDDGWVYFTDPDWQLGARVSETATGFYRVKLAASTTAAEALLIDDTQTRPNGVALSPDQNTLYVGSSDAFVYKWTVAADGSVSGKQQFAQLTGGSDGMAVDCAGNLYVTSGGVLVFAPSGQQLGTIGVAATASNVAFGGDEARTLYITAQDALYAIDLSVPGFPY